MPAALLGNLVFAGLTTLLTTQASLGAINATANLYTINSGQVGTAPPDSVMFQPAFLAQGTGALGAGIGFGAHTLNPVLYTLNGNFSLWYNPNTTAMPGYITQPFYHTYVR